MKQNVGVPIIVIAVVIVVALAAFFGYKMLSSDSSASNMSPNQYKSKMANMNAQPTNNSAGQAGGGGAPSNAEIRQKMTMHAQPGGK